MTPHGKSAAKAEVGGIHKALRCGGGSRAALPAGCVACDGHGDQIETADTAVRRIEVKKPLPFAIDDGRLVRKARESDRRTDLVSPLAIERTRGTRMIASHDRLRPERLGNAQSIGKAKQVRARARTPLSGRILADIPHLRAYARLMTNDDAKRIGGLLAWQKQTGAKRTILVHGDEDTMRSFATLLQDTQVEMPEPNQVLEL